jgi:hypothetical protein
MQDMKRSISFIGLGVCMKQEPNAASSFLARFGSLCLFIVGVLLLIAGFVMYFGWVPLGSPEFGGESAARGDSSVPAEVQAFCVAEQTALEQMPVCPESSALLEKCVSLWRGATGLEEDAVLRLIAAEYRNSGLGLFALDTLLSKHYDATVCEDLVELFPDSKTACMALEKFAGAAGAGEMDVLKKTVEKHRDVRVGRFALIRLGDLERERGDARAAARCWLEAWAGDRTLTPQVLNNLCLYWLESGEWQYPLLLPPEYADDPATDPIRAAALASATGGAPDPGSTQGKFIQAGALLQAGDLASAKDFLLEAMSPEIAVDPAVKAMLGTAAFLLGAETNTSVTFNAKSSVRDRHLLMQCRERGLAWAKDGWGAAAPDTRALLTTMAGLRWLQDAQVDRAVELLRSVSTDGAVSSSWRERAVEQVARTLIEEHSAYAAAGRAYAEYCAAIEAPRNDFLIRAATYCWKGGAYAQSDEQLARLEKTAKTDGEKAALLFLRALNLSGQNESVAAADLLDRLVAEYPKSEPIPEALHMLAADAELRRDQDKAKQCYLALRDRYPDCVYAGEANLALQNMEQSEKGAAAP